MAEKVQVVVVKINVEDLRALQAHSIIDERSAGDLIREAIKKYVESRRNAPGLDSQIEIARKMQEDLWKALHTPGRD